MNRRPFAYVRLLLLLAFIVSASTWASDILPPGFRPKPVGVHALVGGKVVTKPGETIDGATIVIRNGLIEAVGKNVSAPADARTWDMTGLTIYAGFIESYLPVGQTNQAISTTDTESINTEFASSIPKCLAMSVSVMTQLTSVSASIKSIRARG